MASEMHFIAPYHRYSHTLSKHSDRITRDGQVCFSILAFFLAVQNTEKPVQMVWDHWGFNKIACIQSISQMLAGDLFGIWLELEMSLGVFLLTGSLLLPPTPTTHPNTSATPDIIVMPVKAPKMKQKYEDGCAMRKTRHLKEDQAIDIMIQLLI